ncbi:MAG TPA: DUF2141 domain-containing protein [Stellaceae bacterium]|nr:DUF2141 domain-containing protein [Stellaceae bacterium]
MDAVTRGLARGITASIASGLLLSLIARGACAAPVRIEIHGVVKSAGAIHIALFNSQASWDSEDDDISLQVRAVPGTTVAQVDLPPGEYAFFLWDDVIGDGKLAKTWVGFPDEPYAFSNNVRLEFSKPSFSDLRFAVSKQGATQVIQLVQP